MLLYPHYHYLLGENVSIKSVGDIDAVERRQVDVDVHDGKYCYNVSALHVNTAYVQGMIPAFYLFNVEPCICVLHTLFPCIFFLTSRHFD